MSYYKYLDAKIALPLCDFCGQKILPVWKNCCDRNMCRKKYRLEGLRKHRINNPQKANARRKVFIALRNGSLKKKGCVVCGILERVHAHHDDYSKPLDIVWLCLKHHQELHRSSIVSRKKKLYA